MKYIKPPDFKSVKEFEAFYKKIEEDITKILTNDGSARSAKELQEKISQALNGAVAYLSKKNESFVKNELPTAFKEGQDGAKAETKLTAKEAGEILEKQGFKYARTAFNHNTYIELQSALESAGEGLKSRINKIINDLHKQGKDTIYNVQKEIVKDLQQNGILTVEYSNGAKQSLHSYAAMAARSARIESQNIGAIGRALQNGTDYVKMTFVPQCCKLCGAYQDKVYCISGKDKRFPALFKTVLRSGYALPHPNCRHEFIPFYLDMESEDDIKKAISKSKIKYDKNGDLVDVRYQKDIKGYAAWQAGNRQLNTEYKEFLQMQSHFQKKNKPAPYSTLGGFKRARRSDNLSPAFKAWRYRNVDANTFERWAKIKNFRNAPKTVDDLQEIKYNKPKQWAVLLRERKTIEDINAKNWTEKFQQKAIATYYHFCKKGIEITDHGIARLLQRNFDEQQILSIANKKFNYVQADGKYIKFYNEIAVIYNHNKTEIISVVCRKSKKGEWNEL